MNGQQASSPSLGTKKTSRSSPASLRSLSSSRSGAAEEEWTPELPPRMCGKNPGWYVPTMLCEQIVVSGMREYMGGCRYNFPMGKCARNNAYNKGCGQVAQKWAHSRATGMADLSLKLSRGSAHSGGCKTEVSLQTSHFIECYISYQDCKLALQIMHGLNLSFAQLFSQGSSWSPS